MLIIIILIILGVTLSRRDNCRGVTMIGSDIRHLKFKHDKVCYPIEIITI